MIADRVKTALGKHPPKESDCEHWYAELLAKAEKDPGHVYTKHYGFGRAMSVVVPPQRDGGDS